MNPLLKPAFVILSEATKRVLQENRFPTSQTPEHILKKSEAFLQGKPVLQPSPGSLLAGLDKRLGLIELGGEIARLELLMSSLKKSKKYTPITLHSLEAKIGLLKNQVKKRMLS